MSRRTRTPAHLPATPAKAPATDRRTWTVDEVESLGTTTDVVTAGQILGLSRNTAYRLARRDAFPVPVIRAGARYRVPVAGILAVLHPGAGPLPPSSHARPSPQPEPAS